MPRMTPINAISIFSLSIICFLFFILIKDIPIMVKNIRKIFGNIIIFNNYF